MSKFKVGDRVKICPTHILYEDSLFRGNIGTIIKNQNELGKDYWCVQFDNYINGHSCDRVGKDGYCLFLKGESLFLVDTKIYPKDKIKDGDFVKSRDGEVGFVRNHCIYYGLDAIKVSFYNRNLYNDVDMDYDIMGIYRVDEIGNIDVVWERYEYTEDEIQIAKLVADKVKYIARDDDGGLFGFNSKPKKNGDFWYDEFVPYSIKVFNNHFPNIRFQDDEPVLIDDILEFER